MERRFSLYRRGKIWYARLFNPQTEKYLSGRSTREFNRNAAAGKVMHWLEEGIPEPARGRRPVKEALHIDTILEAIRSTALNLGDAERIVRALKDRELIETAVVKAGPGSESLIPFLIRFWDYERSPYVRDKLAHGHQIGRRHCHDYALWIRLHWKPFFAEKRLGEIRKADLKGFSLHLSSKGLAPKTINNILSAGTVALKWARAEEFIPADPGAGLVKFSGAPAKRGVLTEDEVRRLFAVPWTDERGRLGNILAMSTGLRSGEVLGLQVRDIGEDRLFIRHSWSNIDRLKTTKTAEERIIPVIGSIREALIQLARKNPHGVGPISFVFWSMSMADRPMDQKHLLDGLKSALLCLSLGKEELQDPVKVERAQEYWKARRVVFHSWRHFYAARMADRLEARKVMVSTGHRTPTMFQHYADHGTEEIFQEVREVAAETFGQLIAFRSIKDPGEPE